VARLAIFALAAFGSPAVLESAAVNAGTMPTVAGVVSKITAAYGGSSVVNSIQSQEIVTNLSIGGQPATVTTLVQAPLKFLQHVEIPAFHVDLTTGFDGAAGWSKAASGIAPVLGDQLTKLRCQAIDSNDSLLHPDRWPTAVKLLP
jgi:hypothetical protein